MSMEKKTKETHDWMKGLDDNTKMRFAINWKMPHTLFNVASGIKGDNGKSLQGIDWYKIYKSCDLGVWSHGGKVFVQSFK